MDTKELVERCRRGEERAMGLLYTEYVRKMERVSRKYVKNEADVQDILHDSFVIIFTNLDRLKDADKLESWMLTIVRNLSIKHLQQPFAVSMESMEMEDGEEESKPDYSRLMTIVEQLPMGYKNVLKLSVLEGLSHKEIGEMLGIAPHSSSSQLARAKVLVVRSVKRYGVLLLALIAVVIPFLLPEKEQEKKQEIAEKTPEKGCEIMTDSTTTDSTTERILVPVLPRHFIAKQTDEQPKQDTLQTLIAEAIDRDTTATLPIDTTRQEPRIIPDARRDDRLIAEDYQTIKKRTKDTWTLAVSFASSSDNNLLAQASVPGIGSGWFDPDGPGINDPNGVDDPSVLAPDTCTDTRTHHHMPLTFGFSLSKSLSERWHIETGLRYTLLHTDVTTITYVSDGSMPPTTETTEQKRHYIGIPLRLTYSLWSTRQFSLYGSGGAAADIPVGTSAPVLWSVNFGAGLQYKITPSVSLYAEPSLNRYLNPSVAAPTIRPDRPWEFTIPVGLRLSW